MAKAKLLYRSKSLYPDGALREMVIWQLPTSTEERRYQLKYRLYYGDIQGKCFIRYDNETGKGDHRHYLDKEESYTFVSVEKLIADFQQDIDLLRKKGKSLK